MVLVMKIKTNFTFLKYKIARKIKIIQEIFGFEPMM